MIDLDALFESEEFMDVEKAFAVVCEAIHPLLETRMYVKYEETVDVLSKAKDIRNMIINKPPIELATELLDADTEMPMPELVFRFVEKAYRDWYNMFLDGRTYPYRCGLVLGDLYSEERFGHIDYRKAVEWYERGAEVGDGLAEAKLGRCYYYGLGVPQDYEKAYHLMVKWALIQGKGSAEALYLLGDMYYNGYYVTKDKVQAYELYRKAEELLGDYFEAGTAPEVYLRIADYNMREIGDKEGCSEALSYYQKAEQKAYRDRQVWYMDDSRLLDRAEKGQTKARRKLKNAYKKEQAGTEESGRAAEHLND